MQSQQKKELHRIIEWRDGYIYRTEMIGEHWIADDLEKIEENNLAKSLGGDFFISLSFSKMKQYSDVYRTIK